MANLSDKIKEDLKNAQLERNEIKVSTLRLLLSALTYARVDGGSELDDEGILFVIQKEAKKRRESIESFRSGRREELAQKEETELKILEEYLPAQMSDEELTKIVEDTIKELGATSMQDMGKVIGAVMGKVKGLADGGRVSGIVKTKLV